MLGDKWCLMRIYKDVAGVKEKRDWFYKLWWRDIVDIKDKEIDYFKNLHQCKDLQEMIIELNIIK